MNMIEQREAFERDLDSLVHRYRLEFDLGDEALGQSMHLLGLELAGFDQEALEEERVQHDWIMRVRISSGAFAGDILQMPWCDEFQQKKSMMLLTPQGKFHLLQMADGSWQANQA
jgi:hypothetical protein